MTYYAFHTEDGTIVKTIECPEFMAEYMAEEGLLITEIPRQANDKTEIIVGGQLVKKPEA